MKKRLYQIRYFQPGPFDFDLNGTGYATWQIKGELITVHAGGLFLDKLKSPRNYQTIIAPSLACVCLCARAICVGMKRYTVLRYYRGINSHVIDTVRFSSSRYAYGIIALSFLNTCTSPLSPVARNEIKHLLTLRKVSTAVTLSGRDP